MERALVFGDAIGEVTEFPFHFTVHDPTPIRERPIAYAAPQREWIRRYMLD